MIYMIDNHITAITSFFEIDIAYEDYMIKDIDNRDELLDKFS